MSVLSEICFSQSKKFEGYDNMAWGTTLEEFKNKNPSAYDQTSEDNRIRNENFSIKMEIQLLEFTGSLTINSAGEERCI